LRTGRWQLFIREKIRNVKGVGIEKGVTKCWEGWVGASDRNKGGGGGVKLVILRKKNWSKGDSPGVSIVGGCLKTQMTCRGTLKEKSPGQGNRNPKGKDWTRTFSRNPKEDSVLEPMKKGGGIGNLSKSSRNRGKQDCNGKTDGKEKCPRGK